MFTPALRVRHPWRVVVLGLCLTLALPVGSFSGGHDRLSIDDADFITNDPDQAQLGKLLFFDKVLSGNRNMSCAACHHPFTATGDALSLSIGEGGMGLGTGRSLGFGSSSVHERVPRNAPPLFNLGAKEFTIMFHDGRVMVDARQPSGFLSPAGADLPPGLDNVLAVQAMFPVTSGTEMAGQAGENAIADAGAAGNLAGPDGVWELLAQRLRAIDGYVKLFVAAFDDVQTAEDITYVHAVNAIAAFEASAFRCTDAPYDRYLAGNESALGPVALAGKGLFFGRGGCVNCHSGSFQTDQQFHAIGVPQIGPGKGDNLPGYADGRDDFGRERVSGVSTDRFKFRTPSLRQVTLTGPWGHDGAYSDLEAMVRHHLDPAVSLQRYDPRQQVVLPYRADLEKKDYVAHRDPARRGAVEAAIELAAVSLSDDEVDNLLAFLDALTDQSCVDFSQDVPTSVPSGLPLCPLGCRDFEPDLDVTQQVARLIAGDPPSASEPDHHIGDVEILAALDAWIYGRPLPDTDDAMVDDATIMTLMTLWASGMAVR